MARAPSGRLTCAPSLAPCLPNRLIQRLVRFRAGYAVVVPQSEEIFPAFYPFAVEFRGGTKRQLVPEPICSHSGLCEQMNRGR